MCYIVFSVHDLETICTKCAACRCLSSGCTKSVNMWVVGVRPVGTLTLSTYTFVVLKVCGSLSSIVSSDCKHISGVSELCHVFHIIRYPPGLCSCPSLHQCHRGGHKKLHLQFSDRHNAQYKVKCHVLLVKTLSSLDSPVLYANNLIFFPLSINSYGSINKENVCVLSIQQWLITIYIIIYPFLNRNNHCEDLRKQEAKAGRLVCWRHR